MIIACQQLRVIDDAIYIVSLYPYVLHNYMVR